MKKLNKIILIVLFFLLFACFLSVNVSANAPMPADRLTIKVSNLPENAVYADIMIKIDENDSNYVDFQPNKFADRYLKAKQIVDYKENGFRSFTFHYKEAKADIKLKINYSLNNSHYVVQFCGGAEYKEYLTQFEDLRNNYNKVKIALLDENFNIIHISEEFELPKVSNAITFSGYVWYDVSNNTIEVKKWINPYFIIFGGFFSILIILLSIGAELLTALLFGFKGKKTLTILIANACTQIVMRLLYIVLPFTYLIETIILEILVYGGEILIYKKCFKDTKVSKIIAYTVIANTLSLILGILLDCYILS